MLTRFLSIARVSFLESVRQPVYGVVLCCTALMLMFNVSLAAFTLTDDNKLLMELGLSTLLLSGLFVASLSATGILTREIDNKTVMTVIAKPVSRPLFYVGKFVGLLGAVVLSHFLATLVFLLCQRHGVLQSTSDPWDMPVLVLGGGSVFIGLAVAAFLNYFHGKDFVLSALTLVTPLLAVATIAVGFFDEKWNSIAFGKNYPGGQVIIATVLVLLFNIMLAAVATAASARLGQMMTLATCVLFVCLATVSDYAFGQHAPTSRLASSVYAIVPNLSPFWIIEGLYAEHVSITVDRSYLLLAGAYSGLVTVAFVSLGIALFNRREVG